TWPFDVTYSWITVVSIRICIMGAMATSRHACLNVVSQFNTATISPWSTIAQIQLMEYFGSGWTTARAGIDATEPSMCQIRWRLIFRTFLMPGEVSRITLPCLYVMSVALLVW